MTSHIVVRAQHRGDYRIFLEFIDGTKGTVDMRAWLQIPTFEPLTDPAYFLRFSLDGGTVVWPNRVDVPASTLFEEILATRCDTLASRHQVPCPTCQGECQVIRIGGRVSCTTCEDVGRIGNCSDCEGRGVIHGRPLGETGCITCQTKGWIGNCRACRGVGVLDVTGGHAACEHCNGYGHLEADLQPPGPARIAVVARYASQTRFRLACDVWRIRFGRWGRPYTRVDLRLHDPMVAKEHFEIVWDGTIGAHVVRNLGARFLPDVHGDPVDDEGRRLSVGDVITIGAWTLEYVALL